VIEKSAVDNDLRGCLPLDRFEVCLNGAAYAPHRHDTYTIGKTLEGVQCFDYRGEARHACPGDIFVLHPDELHDGRAGTDTGFRYRAFHLQPALVQGVLKGRPLPYIAGGLSGDPVLRRAITRLLSDTGNSPDPLETESNLVDLIDALRMASGASERPRRHDYGAVKTACTFIEAHIEEGIALEQLAAACGVDRYELSRAFRALLGVSPYGYLVHRRLDRACRQLLLGEPSARIAVDCGFSDQSHLIRHFKKAYGLTPRAWLTMREGRNSVSRTIVQ
jgi:AraC-like DNA-binding protein